MITLGAYADYSSGYQYHAMYIDATAGYARVCAAGAQAVGILQDKPDGAGKACNVMTSGVSKCIYGAAVSAGAALMTDSNGHLITQTSTTPIIGVAMVGGTTNDVGMVLLDSKGPSMGIAGQGGILSYTFPINQLTTTGYVYDAMPIGFNGTLVDIWAVATSVCSATTTSTAALEVRLGTAGHTTVGSLAIPVTELKEAYVESFGHKMVSSGTVTAGTFVSTDKISVYVTQGSTTFGGSDTGSITLFVQYV